MSRLAQSPVDQYLSRSRITRAEHASAVAYRADAEAGQLRATDPGRTRAPPPSAPMFSMAAVARERFGRCQRYLGVMAPFAVALLVEDRFPGEVLAEMGEPAHEAGGITMALICIKSIHRFYQVELAVAA